MQAAMARQVKSVITSAYRYITKALHSPSHPDLRDALKTEKAIAAKKRKGKILRGVAQRRKIGR